MEKISITKHLQNLLRGRSAFVPLDRALEGVPFDKLGLVPEGLPYSLWQLAEHIRIAQEDIIRFTKNDNYRKLDWPADYWPAEAAPPDEAAWQATVDAILAGREEMKTLLSETDEEALLTPFAHGQGQTIFREAVLIAEHNAYHTGQIVLVRRLLGCWEE